MTETAPINRFPKLIMAFASRTGGPQSVTVSVMLCIPIAGTISGHEIGEPAHELPERTRRPRLRRPQSTLGPTPAEAPPNPTSARPPMLTPPKSASTSIASAGTAIELLPRTKPNKTRADIFTSLGRLCRRSHSSRGSSRERVNGYYRRGFRPRHLMKFGAAGSVRRGVVARLHGCHLWRLGGAPCTPWFWRSEFGCAKAPLATINPAATKDCKALRPPHWQRCEGIVAPGATKWCTLRCYELRQGA